MIKNDEKKMIKTLLRKEIFLFFWGVFFLFQRLRKERKEWESGEWV